MDVFSCKDLREDQVSCVVDVLRPQQKEHLDMWRSQHPSLTGRSLLFISSVLILPLSPVFQGRAVSTFKGVFLSPSSEETADPTSSSACCLEPDEGFAAFTAAGRSHKDAVTLLGREAGVSALWVTRVSAAAAEFRNMHTCAQRKQINPNRELDYSIMQLRVKNCRWIKYIVNLNLLLLRIHNFWINHVLFSWNNTFLLSSTLNVF